MPVIWELSLEQTVISILFIGGDNSRKQSSARHYSVREGSISIVSLAPICSLTSST